MEPVAWQGGGLGAVGPGRHRLGGGTLLIKIHFWKQFKSSSFLLLFLNKHLKVLKVLTIFNFCVLKPNKKRYAALEWENLWNVHSKVWVKSNVLKCPSVCLEISGVASPKILGGAEMSDFRRITLFCWEKRLSKHKMNIFSKIGGLCPLWPPWLHLCLKSGLFNTHAWRQFCPIPHIFLARQSHFRHPNQKSFKQRKEMTFYGRLANARTPRFILPLLSKSDKKDCMKSW